MCMNGSYVTFLSTYFSAQFETQHISFYITQTSHMSARSVEVTGEDVKTVPNVEAILEDFRVLGNGLVKSVEARTERWSF